MGQGILTNNLQSNVGIDILYSATNNTFDDGLKTGSVTLSQNISNYQYIEVYGVSSDGDLISDRLYTGGVSSIRSTLDIISYSVSNSRYYYKIIKFTISNTSFGIVSQQEHRLGYNSSNQLDTSDCLNYPDTDVIAITRVIGYK